MPICTGMAAQADTSGPLRLIFEGPESHKFFKDCEAVLSRLGGIEHLAKLITSKRCMDFKKNVRCASLVFAHSVLDASLYEYCSCTSLIAPDAWRTLVRGRPVSLQDMHDYDRDQLLRGAIQEILREIERDSIVKQTDRLYQICEPSKNFKSDPGYQFDRRRLEALDGVRHDIVHGTSLVEVPALLEDITYMQSTAAHFMVMVLERFHLEPAPNLFSPH